MPGHVHQVARPGHEPGQPLRAGHGALGFHRLHRVDEQVAAPGVIGVGRQHALDARQDGERGRTRAAVRHPVPPRAQVHQSLGVERLQVEVLRVPIGEAADRVGPGGVGRGATPRGIIPLPQGADHPLLPLPAPGEGQRTPGCRPCLHPGGAVHRRVDVRAERQRLPEGTHGARRIPPFRLGEGPHRLGVVEGPVEPQALIEVGLGHRIAGGDGIVQGTEIVVQGHRVGGVVLPVPLAGEGAGQEGGAQRQQVTETGHVSLHGWGRRMAGPGGQPYIAGNPSPTRHPGPTAPDAPSRRPPSSG
jgi:hypothetical protein